MRAALVLLCSVLTLAGCGCDEQASNGPPATGTPTDGVEGTAEPGRTTFATSADIVGRWSSTSVPSDMWIAFRKDGRYRYSGLSSPKAGPAVPGTDTPGAGISGTGGTFPWMTAHTGTWAWTDGALSLTPDDEKVRELLPFEFDADEGSLNLRVVGRGPTGPRWLVFWQDAAD